MKDLESLKTENVDINATIDFILHTVYNRSKKEKTPRDTKFEMLAGNRNNTKKYVSTKVPPPDAKSLEMKIKRANFISHIMCNCLERNYIPLDPLKYRWKKENEKLVPIWFEGSNLPSDEEYERRLEESKVDEMPSEDMNSEDDDSDDDVPFPLSDDDYSEESDGE